MGSVWKMHKLSCFSKSFLCTFENLHDGNAHAVTMNRVHSECTESTSFYLPNVTSNCVPHFFPFWLWTGV